jgi:rubrerythrin
MLQYLTKQEVIQLNGETAQKLESYIKAELGDSALYTALAAVAPNDDDRKLLTEFAADEKAHATEFQRIYKSLTGKEYNPTIAAPVLSQPYRDILRERVLDESGDFRKYGEQYLITDWNSTLKSAYYRARTDEAVHALRLLYLLSK